MAYLTLGSQGIRRTRRACLTLAVMLSWVWRGCCAAWLLAGGCNAPSGPSVLVVDSAAYDATFTAAVEAARRAGLPAVFQDRRAGIIETEPLVAGSILEPWRTDNDSFSQTMQMTLSLQRRRARFEFTPTEFQPEAAAVDQPLDGPDLLGLDQRPVDLTQDKQPLELRVWVYVERAHTAGLRRSTWTRRKTTRSELVWPERDQGLPGGQFWTPVERDPSYEARLLGEVQALMAKPDALAVATAEISELAKSH